ncbi:MAG: hypothetical protein AAGJ18_27425, partial [Bacteroidota bacterium]
MRIALSSIFLFAYVSVALGQTNLDYQPLFYRISTAEFIQLQEGKEIDSSYLHTPVDISIKKLDYDHYGYFIEAHPDKEDLRLTVIAQPSVSIIPLHNQRDFALRVVDSMGIALKTANVYWNKKRIPYHSKTKSYRLKKWSKRTGQLKVLAQDEVVYYNITQKPDWYHPNKTFGYHLKAPARWVKNGYWKTRNWAGSGGFWAPYDREYKGYIAFNQPKYRPNDTLKIKAFLANKRGKPLKKALELNISGGKGRFKQMVTPTTLGNYTSNIVLHDSLNFDLDRNCRVWFYDERINSIREVKSHHFYLEDYQLDEVVYDLKTDEKTYEYGEKISIQAMGKYQTGQFIADGSVRLVVQTDYATQYLSSYDFFDQEVLVKDTVWTT